MTKSSVRFLQGNSTNLPTSAQTSDLLFALDTGSIYKGNGDGNPLTPFASVLFGYTDLADLQAKVPNGINGKLYLLDDNNLYRFKNGIYELVASSQSMDSFDASDVTFDKTSTTLNAENVQDAIAEVDVKVETNKSDITSLKSNEGKMKADTNDTLGYLSDKVDGTTVQVVGGKLVVKNIEGVTVGFADINKLTGVTANVQSQLDTLDSKINSTSSGMNYGGTVNTYADLANITSPTNGMLVVVLADENNDGGRGAYIYNDTTSAWDYFGTFEMTQEFISLSDTPNAHENGKYLVSDGTKLVFTDLDYDKLINKPTSTVAQIDKAVTDSHTHANKLQLDKISEDVDGNPLYDGKPFGGSELTWESWDI